ncbi:MAG TPA: DUF1343 domain-containing protein [Desulfopila sp.]|nr:DUF1343 domain-containing protein [Desulfopila sp.]
MIAVGLEKFLESEGGYLYGKKLGLLTNQASVNRDLIHNRLLLQEKYGPDLTTLFSPQHGFYSEKQDNMVESEHLRDQLTGLPIYSLYGDVRKPSEEMLEDVDVLVIDLMDVGTRVYTFMYTMVYCLQAAAEYGKRVVVLDRPNPLGGWGVEGNVLETSCSSFVGLYPLPMRHGLTLGELALYFNSEFSIGADLEVITMTGWKRGMLFDDTGFPWVFPSPNMPTPATALVYAGQVVFEGTNISEGRGTTLPFELVGAPFVDHEEIFSVLRRTELPGCFLRPILFQPTSGKWANRVCTGFQIHVTDSRHYRPYRTALALLQSFMLLYGNEFEYKEPPYEYEYQRLPLDLILGSSEIRRKLEEGTPIESLEAMWQEELQRFDRLRRKYFLYEE